MTKRFIRKFSPEPNKLRQHKHLKLFGAMIHNPNLWHINRHSISAAFAVGIFCAFIPVPFQMLIAAAFAILFQVNMPVSVALVWISNPLTVPPLFYGCYLLGAWLLQLPSQEFSFELSWHWLSQSLLNIWQPFLFGCLIAGIVCSIAGYFSVKICWRLIVIKKWNARKFRRDVKRSD